MAKGDKPVGAPTIYHVKNSFSLSYWAYGSLPDVRVLWRFLVGFEQATMKLDSDSS